MFSNRAVASPSSGATGRSTTSLAPTGATKLSPFAFMGSLATSQGVSGANNSSSSSSGASAALPAGMQGRHSTGLRRGSSSALQAAAAPAAEDVVFVGEVMDPIEELAQSFRTQEMRLREMEHELKEEKSLHQATQKQLQEVKAQLSDKDAQLKETCEEVVKLSKGLSDSTSGAKALQAQLSEVNQVRTQLIKQNGELRALSQDQKKKFVRLMTEANERIKILKLQKPGNNSMSTENSMEVDAPSSSLLQKGATESCEAPTISNQAGPTKTEESEAMVLSNEEQNSGEAIQQNSGEAIQHQVEQEKQQLVQQIDLLHFYLDEMHGIMENCSACAPKLAAFLETQDTQKQQTGASIPVNE